jgi:hypothetical protein
VTEQVCASCRQVIVDDPSGFCEDCQEGIPSQKPGSITGEQRQALIGLLMDQGLVGEGKSRHRAELIAEAVPGWKWGGDLGALSQQQAGDVLELLERVRRL